MRYFAPFLLAFMAFLASTHAANPLPKVVIYTMPGCFGCELAKSMFKDRGIDYQEIEIDVKNKPEVYKDMIRKTGGRRTVPQVFINDKYIGGYYDLDASELDALKNQGTAEGEEATKAPSQTQ